MGNSVVPNKSKSVTVKHQFITPEQQILLRESWLKVKENCRKVKPYEFGLCLFENVFVSCPQLIPIFDYEENEGHKTIKPFQRHARIFSSIVDLMVRNVDQIDNQIGPALTTYGRRHYYRDKVDFPPAYVDIFTEEIVKAVMKNLPENEGNKKETEELWRKLVDYMGMKMKEGYELEENDKQMSKWMKHKHSYNQK